jgi:hypothetical protein
MRAGYHTSVARMVNRALGTGMILAVLGMAGCGDNDNFGLHDNIVDNDNLLDNDNLFDNDDNSHAARTAIPAARDPTPAASPARTGTTTPSVEGTTAT